MLPICKFSFCKVATPYGYYYIILNCVNQYQNTKSTYILFNCRC
nr:MAG TPA: hypothetical protein [Caudoviricetes sp.]